jgi:hypothetical protein
MEGQPHFIADEIRADVHLLTQILNGEPIACTGLPLHLILEIANQIREKQNLPLYELQLIVPKADE